jgi:hypothetical protein
MHAPDPNQEKKKGIEPVSPACSYSLESLMALQKLLENGFPDAPTPLPRPAAVEKSFQPVFRPQSDRNPVRPETDWKARLHYWLMKLRKAKEADKGNSAQQSG